MTCNRRWIILLSLMCIFAFSGCTGKTDSLSKSDAEKILSATLNKEYDSYVAGVEYYEGATSLKVTYGYEKDKSITFFGTAVSSYYNGEVSGKVEEDSIKVSYDLIGETDRLCSDVEIDKKILPVPELTSLSWQYKETKKGGMFTADGEGLTFKATISKKGYVSEIKASGKNKSLTIVPIKINDGSGISYEESDAYEKLSKITFDELITAINTDVLDSTAGEKTGEAENESEGETNISTTENGATEDEGIRFY